MNQKTVAREWLLFTGLVSFGALVLIPMIAYGFYNDSGHVFDLYGAALFGDDASTGWRIALTPYLLVQVGRSIAWAIRRVRSPH
jgi:hypothetical protein